MFVNFNPKPSARIRGLKGAKAGKPWLPLLTLLSLLILFRSPAFRFSFCFPQAELFGGGGWEGVLFQASFRFYRARFRIFANHVTNGISTFKSVPNFGVKPKTPKPTTLNPQTLNLNPEPRNPATEFGGTPNFPALLRGSSRKVPGAGAENQGSGGP